MLSTRFHSLIVRHLGGTLATLTVRGFVVGVIAAIMAAVARRRERLELLMDRFEAGTLRTRPGLTRKASARLTGCLAPAAAKAWPEHRAGWLDLVGMNNPVMDIRRRWAMWQGNQPPNRRLLGEFCERLTRMLAEDAALRGLLAVSREARRHMRWLLRMGSAAAMPEVLREPARPRRTRAGGKRRPSVPRPVRMPGPFEVPPADLMRDEREARGMRVPPPRFDYESALNPTPPDAVREHWRR